MMRGINTTVRRLRRKVFEEVAALGFKADADTLCDDMEAIPYALVNDETEQYRDSVYRARAVVREQVRLAMGLALRPEDKPVHLTAGVEASNISDKYYEPPLMQVIPSACMRCEAKGYEVSNMCKGCLAHPCMEVCPKGAISMVNGKSYIDQEKCIKCGKCKSVCPYDAISKKERPCAKACGVNAIENDKVGRAYVNPDKCVSCGMCMVNCPFGAISDKSQIFQLARALSEGEQIIAEIAPAFTGQFGDNINARNLKAALEELGFSQVYEVALGADIGAVAEAHHYVEKVTTGELPFLLTSCCPSWAMLAKKYFPDMIDEVSQELTPMVATARTIKKEHPNAKVVFIGPCAAKKLEAMRRSVRSDVDFVVTFEELQGMFDAKEIDLSEYEAESSFHNATGVGRGYAVAGGVASAEDITQGLPRVEELFEARKPKSLAIISEIDGDVRFEEIKNAKHAVIFNKETGEERAYLIPFGFRVKVFDGDHIKKGDKITDGAVNPHDILDILGPEAVMNYLISEVQSTYRLQGVEINDKHIEVIVRQMMRKVKVEDAGDTGFMSGQTYDKNEVLYENEQIKKRIANGEEGLREATFTQLLLGITKAALATDSFLSAASFQETTRVLTDAAIKGKVDPLVGLKENVILGKIIPAGTGMQRYADVQLESNSEAEIVENDDTDDVIVALEDDEIMDF